MSEFFRCNNFFMWAGFVSFAYFGVTAVPTWFGGWVKWKEIPLLQGIYQFWFNALGGFVGWVAAYYLWAVPPRELTIAHVTALVIAFLGVTGNLPAASQRVGFGR